ncbi:nucleoside phosphorylase domain-containing protein [Polychytrium aggregatum]|uniref:nucleoside phosphorylase domain-containing protein n=1 Tax=Polychytrium aggregatum TaxID=110093 RepID=UPI0022FEF8CC|nr:nucleoside phosphorylase domain-containing protein [Polychytrium aggregatum]KAI9205804.1 nucleoside phosphorylase domain-containing protein [Polychytrium aggregatum]
MTTPNNIPPPDINYYAFDTYQASAQFLRNRLPPELQAIQIGIICGSGLGGLAKTLEEPICEVEYKDIPNFAVSTVPGHVGKLVFGMLAGRATVCMVGRKHMYEGHSLLRTVFPVRVMRLLGAHTLLVTNAAGGLNPDFNVGDIMIIKDHLSIAGFGGCNPLIGANVDDFGPRFPAVSNAYDFDLRVTAFSCATACGLGPFMREGIYAFVPGPSFETRAEARYIRNAGADSVGMSTVPEVIIARHCGMRVLGVSLITNIVPQGHGRSAMQAAAELEPPTASSPGSVSSGPDVAAVMKSMVKNVVEAVSKITEYPHKNDEKVLANHEEVLETSNKRSQAMQELVRLIVGKIPEPSKQ